MVVPELSPLPTAWIVGISEAESILLFGIPSGCDCVRPSGGDIGPRVRTRRGILDSGIPDSGLVAAAAAERICSIRSRMLEFNGLGSVTNESGDFDSTVSPTWGPFSALGVS